MILTKEIVEELLKENSFEYVSSQKKICYPKLERIFRRLSEGKDLHPIKFAENRIVEGHHRYLCSILLKKTIEMVKGGNNLSHKISYPWNQVMIDEIDWDSPDEINKYQKLFD